MKTILIAAAILVAGIAIGFVSREKTVRSLRKRLKALRSSGSGNPMVEGMTTHEKYLYYKMLDGLQSGTAFRNIRKQITQNGLLRSITRLFFVTTQISALVWVYTSYGIAIYSTVMLGQVYTMAELSEPAIHTILGVGSLKVLENIFEHNEGVVFGRNKQEEHPPDDGGDTEV